MTTHELVARLDDIVVRLDRLEARIAEILPLLRRRPTPGGGTTTIVPGPRQLPNGSWETWGGEGTGWITCDPPHRKGEKK